MTSVLALLVAIVLLLLFRKHRFVKKYLGTALLALVVLAFAITLIRSPDEAFDAALSGLKIWWETVFPALLPFFIASEVLMGVGVVNAMGVLLEPLMRPLFNVPGAGSFVMAMGLASGYPIGAILTAKLRRRNLCNQVEGERLFSFCNTADPLFMTGAVAVGMFGDARLGLIIITAHYLSALLVGFCMRFYRRHEPNSPPVAAQTRGNILTRSARELYRARAEDGRSLGQLLGDSARNSVNALLMIGGFIILFSVIMRMATVTGLVDALGRGIASLLALVGLSPNLSSAIISGVFETTIGCVATSQAVAPLMDRIIVVGALIGWSGLSVIGQVASVTNDSDLAMAPFFFARFLQAIFAGVITWLLWGPLGVTASTIALPVFLQTQPTASVAYWVSRFAFVGSRMLLLSALTLGLSVVYHTASILRIAILRRR